jgi:asparagine synthase (glutamine-hydrolysing)
MSIRPAPAVIGVFPLQHESDISLDRGARRVWPDLPGMWTVGSWHPGELRTARHRDTGLLVLGQCLAGDDRVAADLRRAVDTGHPGTLGTWPGSYTVILVRDTEMTALVDLAGQFPLYYRTGHGRTVLGSRMSPTAMAAGLPVRPDMPMLAAHIFCPDVSVLAESRSMLRGVSRLGGGQAMRVDLTGNSRVWTADPLTPDPTVSLTDAAAGLRSALDAAVRARVAGNRLVTADLSGGLDSTSVAFLAAGHTSRAIPVFTYHHPDAPAGDLVHAQRYARLGQKFLPEVVLGTQDTLTYRRLRPSVSDDLPNPAASARVRTRLRLGRIAASGSEIHLGGEGGDALLTPSPAYLADLATRGSLRDLIHHAHVLGRRREVSPTAVFRRSIRASRTSMSRALAELAQRLEQPAGRPTAWMDGIAWWADPGVEAAWMTGRTRRELAELCRATSGRTDLPGPESGIADFTALRELRTAATVQRQLIETAREHDVWPHAPFLDDDVIRACTRIAAYRRADPGTVKPLLRSALAGLIPEPVLTRSTKGNYVGEDYQGVRVGGGGLTSLISGSHLAELGVVDAAAVINSITRARTGAHAPFAALNRLLGVELWLRGLAAPEAD